MDNEILEEVDAIDVMSLLANESEDEDDDDHEDGAEAGESIEAVQARLSKRNKSLKKAKQAQHRTQEENELLKKRLDDLERRLTGSQPNVEAAKEEQEAQEWRDRVADDPTQALAYADYKQKNLEDRVANYLGTKLQEFESKFGSLQSAVDPEKQKYKDQIESLRRKDGFSALDDDTLLTVVKGFERSKLLPRGGIGGGKVTTKTPTKKFELTEEQRTAMGF